jgi:hypothetical protein
MTGNPVTQVAVEYPPETAAGHVLEMLAASGRAPSEAERLAAVDHVEWLVRMAATEREPAGLAAFTVALSGNGARDLAERALDMASVRREPADLARLVTGLQEIAPGNVDACESASGEPGQAEIGRPGQADLVGWLLAAVIRRRLPGDVAVLLRTLDESLAGRLLAAIVAAGSVPDALSIVFALRMGSADVLALKLSDALAARLEPAAVAAFVNGLLAQGNQAHGRHVVLSALSRDIRQVADFVQAFFASGDRALADWVLGEAVSVLTPADRIVLATLLLGGPSREAGDHIWATCTHDLGGDTLVAAFDALKEQAGSSGLSQELQEAAKALRIELIAELVPNAHRWPDDGGAKNIFTAVARYRSVGEIGKLAECLLRDSERDLAWELLNLATEVVPSRDGVSDAAELIILLVQLEETERQHRFRRDPWRWSARIPGIIDGVASRRSPPLIMGMIDRLAENRSYEEYGAAIKAAVVREFTTAQLASLPHAGVQVCGRAHMRVVLEIARQAVVNPQGVPARSLPGLITALREAGAPEEQIRGLLKSTGSHPYLEAGVIWASMDALAQAGMLADAELVRAARRR